jgi:hypothetical protein
MLRMRDEQPHVGQQRSCLEVLSTVDGQPVKHLGCIKQRRRKMRNLLGMRRFIVALFQQTPHAATGDVSQVVKFVTINARDGVQQNAFPQREVGDHQLLDVEGSHHLVQNEGAGQRYVGTLGVHALQVGAIFRLCFGKQITHVMHVLRG